MNRTKKLHIHVILLWSITRMACLTFILLVSPICVGTSINYSHYINHNCQQKNSYNSSSVFEANLNYTLFTHFPTEASHFGFSNFTKGTDVDQVYALYNCKGDVDTITCKNCVDAAVKKIADACKFWKEGVVWFEECTLRYANRSIFSIDEEAPHFLYYNNTGIVTEHHLDSYQQILTSTMDALIHQVAYSKETHQGFWKKQVNISSSEILQVLGQCTPDIVGRLCYKCLKAALRLRDTWANTVVYLPSCLLRYDLYVTVPPPLAPPSSRPPSSQQASHIAIIVVVLILIVAVVVGGLRLRDRFHGLPKFNSCEVKRMTRGFSRVLGSGACGVVYYGKLLDGSTEVAVKLLNKSDGHTQFSNEMNVFKMIRHNNLVSLIGYCESWSKLALVCGFMSNGDLKDLLSDDERSGDLSWEQRLQIAIGTAEGLHYLHNHCLYPIVHRDVKPSNILLHERNGTLEAKVADFGYSKIFPAGVTTLETRVIGTPGYTAPEYSITTLLNNKVDVYSYGVVLIQLITGIAPSLDYNVLELFEAKFNTHDMEEILDSRMRNRDIHPDSLWKAAALARSCVNRDPERRPNMSQIVTELTGCASNIILVTNPIAYLDTILEDREAQQNEGSCSMVSASNFETSPISEINLGI